MIPTREQIEGDWGDPRYSMATVVRTWLRAMRDEIDRITAELAALKPSEEPVRMVSIRASTLEQVRDAMTCASEANYTSGADMRIRWGLSEGRCVIEEVQRLCYAALHALDSDPQEVTEPVRMSRHVRDCIQTSLNYALVNTSAVSYDDVLAARKFVEALEKMPAQPAPVEQPAAAVPETFTYEVRR